MWVGFLLAASGLGGLILGTAMLGRRIAPPEVAVGCVVGGAIALGLYARHALRVTRPLLDLRLLRLRTFEIGIAGGLFFRFGVGASAFLLPLMLQLAFGLDALQSGLLTFAGALGAFAVKPLARGILHRFGFRRLLLVNGVLASLVLLASALFTPATPHLVIIGVLLCGGFLRSLQFTSLSAITYAEVESRQVGSATSMASVAQQVSVSFGVAVGAMVVETSEALRGHATPQTEDFAAAFVAVGLMSMTSALLMLRLPADAGDEISGRAVPASAPSRAPGGIGELVSRGARWQARARTTDGASSAPRAWQRAHGWLIGCNYTPAYAANQIECWSRELFDPAATASLGRREASNPTVRDKRIVGLRADAPTRPIRRAGGRWRCGRCGRWGWWRWRRRGRRGRRSGGPSSRSCPLTLARTVSSSPTLAAAKWSTLLPTWIQGPSTTLWVSAQLKRRGSWPGCDRPSRA